MTTAYDTVILGAGAAGMMCAAHAGARGGRVLVLDHAKAPGEKIRISGGGRCNFTNLHAGPESFLSENPHFAKSALSRCTQHDFIALVDRHRIPWHEKTLGQLFCDTTSKDVIRLLLDEMAKVGAELRLETTVESAGHGPEGFTLRLSDGQTVTARHFVVACGGKSIPKMGATGLAYRIAEEFGHAVTETRAALVPLTFGAEQLTAIRPLAGVAVDARVTCDGVSFDEALLFTHRGLSGPAILQISSYWREKSPITVTLSPGTDALSLLKDRRATAGRKSVATVLGEFLPNRLAVHIAAATGLTGPVGDLKDAKLATLAEAVQNWRLTPIGTEGYRTAEVTLGGVSTNGLSSQTMESKTVPGLYFIGECVDVTGWLGGYNFQWAWSSGWAAGTAIAER